MDFSDQAAHRVGQGTAEKDAHGELTKTLSDPSLVCSAQKIAEHYVPEGERDPTVSIDTTPGTPYKKVSKFCLSRGDQKIMTEFYNGAL